MLMVMEHHVHRLGLRCCTIRGDVPALKRMELVEAFNTDPDGPQVRGANYHVYFTVSYLDMCVSFVQQ